MGKSNALVRRGISLAMATTIMAGNVGMASTKSTFIKADDNVFAEINSSFEIPQQNGDTTGVAWWYGSSATLEHVEADDAKDGASCLKVTQLGLGKWIGAATNATDKLQNGKTYEYSYYVKLAQGSTGSTTEVRPVINRVYDSSFSSTDQDTEVTSNEPTLSETEWTLVTGQFKMETTYNGQKAEQVHFVINANGTDSYFVDDLRIVEVKSENEDDSLSKGDNLLLNGDFENGTDNWWVSGGKLETVPGLAVSGTAIAKVSGRTESWNSLIQNVESVVENDTTYDFSFWAKLGEEYGDESRQIQFGTTSKDSTQSSEQYDALKITGGIATVNASEWTQIKGSVTVKWKGDLEHLQFKIAEQGQPLKDGSYGSFYIDDVVFVKSTTQNEEENTQNPDGTLLINPDFENGLTGWYASGGSLGLVKGTPETGEVVSGTSAAYMYNRTENWNCIAQRITDLVENKKTYEFSFYAKLGEEYGDQTRTVAVGTTKKDSKDQGPVYDRLNVTGGSATVSSKEWTKITGTIDVKWNGELEYLDFKVVEQGAPLSDGTFGSYYVDNFTFKEAPKKEYHVQTDLMPLKDFLASEKGIDGYAGVAIPANSIDNDAIMQLVTHHYNSISFENEMKPSVILGSHPTFKTDESGEALRKENGDKVLSLDFSQGDAMLDYIYDYNRQHPDSKIGVRGHVLVWHSQTPDWFFREEYDEARPYVTKEVMLQRMHDYIKEVIEHYDGPDSKYKGMIYTWDVVNEQIEPMDYDPVTNPNSLRYHFLDGNNTGYYNVFKGDDIYIRQAFVWANQYAPKNVTLCYNDYSETTPEKSKAIAELMKRIKATEGARIDGMGMQAHYSMETPSIEEFEEAVRLFSSVVDEIQLTELDIQSSWNYDGSNVQEEWQKSADRYREIYNKIYELDAEEGINITGITNWGTHDEVSWLNDMSNVGGGADGSRPQCPLLFDNDLQAKPAYYAITGQMELFPTIKSKAILYSKDGSFTSASEKMNIGNAGIFQTVWNESGLQVQVRVSDSNITQDDKVIVYVDPTNSRTDGVTPVKYEVKATDAKKVDGGYEVTVTLPTDQLAINSAFGFDVAIVNDGVMTSWNDTTNNQETSSKFYGLLKCKPFLTIEKGTVTVDGDEDDIWASVEEVPLTIKTSNVNASATVKTLWDEENLYVYAKVEDNDLNDSNVLPYEQDSFEIFVDQNNAKTSSYQTDDCQYRISYKNNVSINALDGGNTDYSKAIKSETKLTETGYVVETSIKWTDIKPNNNTAVGLEFQINDASSQGVRIGTASWNDETGLGYCNTSVYGTALLVDSSDDGNNSGSDSENNGSNGGSNSGNGGSTNGGVTGESTKPETDNSDNNGSNGGSNTESGNTTEDNKKPVSVGTVVKRVNANYKVTEVKDGKCNLIFSNTALKPVTASIASTVTINGVKYPVTEIAKNTFKNSKTLKEVSIGKNVAVVNNDAFRNCTSLTTIRGLESVETFGKNAFRGCKKLKTVTLGKNVTSIGTYAFADNASLKTITINSDKLTKVGKNAFKNVNKDVTIKVPKKQLDEYKKLLKNAGLPKTAKIVGYTVK